MPDSTQTTRRPSAPTAEVPVPAFLAVTRDQRLAVISTATGKIDRYLTVGAPGGGPSSMSLPGDESTVYFARGMGTCASEIDKVPFDGGNETQAVRPAAPWEGDPAVRPDGQLLAYSRYYCQGDDTPELVIAPTRAGSAPVWVYPNYDAPAGPQSWSPDGTELVTSNPSNSRVIVLRMAGNGSATVQRVLSPPDRACFLGSDAIFSADNWIIVTQFCGVQGPNRRDSILAIDPSTGKVQQKLLTLAPGFDGAPIALDPTGQYLLYDAVESIPTNVVLPNEHPIPADQDWLLVDGHSTRFPVADGYGSILWLTNVLSARSCLASQLSALGYRGSGGGGQEAVVVVFRNGSSSSCQMLGYPTAWFVNKEGVRISAVSIEQAAAPPTDVVLAPGGEAATTVTTENPDFSSAPYCQPETASGLEVIPPLQTRGLLAATMITICTAHSNVTTIPVTPAATQSEI